MTLLTPSGADQVGGAMPEAEATPVAGDARDPAPCPRGPASVELHLNPRRLWRWHLWLIEALAVSHPGARVRFVEGGPPLPRSLALLLSLERVVFRLPGEHACDALRPGAFAAYLAPPGGEEPGIVLDLSGAGRAAGPGRVLRPSYGGLPDENALFASLLAGALPSLAVSDAASPHLGWAAWPAVRDRGVLTRALDAVFSRQLSLCRRAVSALEHGIPAGPMPPAEPRSRALLGFAAAMLVERVNSRLQRLCRQGLRWVVGWRAADEGRLHQTEALPGSGYATLPDDGRRYYADPFLIEVEGRLHLFCEEFDYALGRGIISATSFGPDGRPGEPRPVLERPYHLSYPHVFAHAGQIWMIPETTAARRVELYRADPFPHRWVHAAVLLHDVVAADATLVREDGRWWMFAATAERQSSDWDALSLFHAPGLFGPWTQHPANPVLVDVTASRPGGAFYRRNGRLYRPAQDCSTGYGGALALCAVDRLDPEGYAQTRRALVRPGPGWPGRGLHTVNWSAGIEVVDGLGPPGRRGWGRNAEAR